MGSYKYIKKIIWGGWPLGKIDASLNEKLNNVEWGEYKLESLFEIYTVKSIDKGNVDIKIKKEEGYQYEFIGRTAVNNGVQGYVKKMTFEPNEKNTFSVIQIGENIAQFRDKEWYGSQNLFKLKTSNKKIIDNKLFFVSAINKTLKRYLGGYTSYPTLSELKQIIINLPIKNNEIDYDFMEFFVAELNAQRVAELNAYLNVTGLNDYKLTEEEINILDEYKDITFEDYNIMNIFNVKNTKNILIVGLTHIYVQVLKIIQ